MAAISLWIGLSLVPQLLFVRIFLTKILEKSLILVPRSRMVITTNQENSDVICLTENILNGKVEKQQRKNTAKGNFFVIFELLRSEVYQSGRWQPNSRRSLNHSQKSDCFGISDQILQRIPIRILIGDSNNNFFKKFQQICN